VERSIGAKHAMARDDQWEGIGGFNPADSPGGLRFTSLNSQVFIGQRLPIGYLSGELKDPALETSPASQIEGYGELATSTLKIFG
jgi:hypothetical protein